MIHELLSVGKENAKTGRELCDLLQLQIRDLTQRIEMERRAGFPICASSGANPGYYLAADKEEMAQYCNGLMRRAGAIHKTRRACLKTLDKLPAGGTDDERKDCAL